MILSWILVWVVPLAAPVPAQAQDVAQPTVQSIAVRGNDQVPVEEILDVITATRIGRPLNPEDLQKDAQAILDLGTFESVTFQLPPVPGGVQVVFVVDELPVLTQVVLQGLDGQQEALLAETGLETGKVINLNQVRDALATVQYQALQQRGLLVYPDQTPTWSEEGVLTLSFAPVRLNEIRTEGNEKTLDYVILREMEIESGEPIDLNRVDRGLRDVLQLGFFDQVGRRFEETGDPGTLDLVVQVQERKTGTASLGVTWSDPGGFGGYVDVADVNFLGRGQEVGVKLQVGGKSSEYELRFREPYLTASGLSLGVSVFNRNRVATLEGEDHGWYHDLGTSVSLGHPVGSYSRLIGTLSLDNRTYDRPVPPDHLNSSYRALELALVTDTTDHPFFPTEGFRNRLSATSGGGPLGGDWTHQIYQETFSKYIKVGSSNQVVAFRIDTGVLFGEARSTERFLVGSADSVRGHPAKEGDRKLVANVEYRFPIADLVQGVIFADVGNAWAGGEEVRLDDLRKGYGVGIRINTPIGMLRLDYAMSREHSGQPYISIGQTF